MEETTIISNTDDLNSKSQFQTAITVRMKHLEKEVYSLKGKYNLLMDFLFMKHNVKEMRQWNEDINKHIVRVIVVIPRIQPIMVDKNGMMVVR